MLRINNFVFLKNYLNLDFRAMLLPLHFLQCIYLTPKFQIQGNFFKTNSHRVKAITGCVYIFLTITDIIRLIYTLNEVSLFNFEPQIVSKLVSVFELVYYFFGLLISYKINILNSKNHINFLVKLQRSTNNNSKKARILKNLAYLNWLAVVCLLFSHISIYLLMFPEHIDIISLSAIYKFLSFDIHLIYTTQMIMLIRINLKSLILQIKTSIFGVNNLNKYTNVNWEQFFQKYLNLLQLYEDNRKTVQILVSS